MPNPRWLLEWAARLAAVLAFSVLATSSLLPFGAWPDTHEDLRYQFLTALFAESQAAGFWYPRWLPGLAGGYGYPTFVFYQPGFFFCAAVWMQVVGGPAAATYCAVLTFTTLGGVGAYLVGRQLADEWSAWFGAGLFLLTPYLFVNLLVRGDLSELAAMLLVPWLLYFVLLVVRRAETSQSVSPTGAGLGLTLAAMVYCHPMVALLASGMLLILAIALASQQAPWRPLLLASAQASLITAAFSIFYALPLVQMSRYVDFQAAISGYYTPSDHAVYPLQFLQSTWGFGGSKPGLEDDMSFQLGLPHAGLAIAGLIACWRDRVYRAMFCGYALLVIAATNWFGWLWDIFFPLRVVQFPWRVLAVTAALQAALASGIHKWLPKEPPSKLLILLLLSAVVLYWSLPQFRASTERNYGVDAWVREHQERLLVDAITFTGADEFRPRTAKGLREAEPRGARPLVEGNGSRRIEPAAHCTPQRISYQIDPGPPSELVINQAYFPGWHVELGGRVIPAAVLEERLTADGRMSVLVDNPQQQMLVAYYAGPPGGLGRLLMFALLFGVFVTLAVLERRTRPLAATESASDGPPPEPPAQPQSRERKRRKSKTDDDAT